MRTTHLITLAAAAARAFADEYGGGYDADEYGGGMPGGMGGMGGMGGYGGDEYGMDGMGGMGGMGGMDGDEAGPPFTELNDPAEVAKFIADEELEPTVIGLFDEDTNPEDLEAFQAVAEAMRWDVRFGLSTEDDVREHYKVKGGFAVYAYLAPRFFSEKYGERKRARYPDKAVNEETLKKFVSAKTLPLVGQKTWKSNSAYDKSNAPIVTLFVDVDHEKNRKGYDYFANRMRKVAVDAPKLKFNIADKEDFSYILTDYGIALEGKKDVGVGIKDGSMFYKMDDTFSVDALRAFVADFQAGTLTGKYKEEEKYDSEPPADDDGDDGAEDHVVHLSDDTFAGVVNDASTDALVEFYAPWCGHCKSLKPVYKKVAAEFADDDGITIAAADATSLEVPSEFDVAGYPTVYWVPASGPSKAYDGARDFASMVEFVKENRSQGKEL